MAQPSVLHSPQALTGDVSPEVVRAWTRTPKFVNTTIVEMATDTTTQRQRNSLIQMYDYSLPLVSLICMALDIWIVIDYFIVFDELLIHAIFLCHTHSHTLKMQISLVLSMFAVSMIIANDISNWINSSTVVTTIFIWLCVITDIFGMFLIIFYLFESHDSFFIIKQNDDFFYKYLAWNGYFNVFGQLWMLKYLVFSMPLAIVSVIAIFVSLWTETNCCFKTIALIISLPVLVIGPEVLTFMLMILFMHLMLTSRFDVKDTSVIALTLDFIRKGDDQEVIRLICANYAIYTLSSDHNQHMMRHSINAFNTLKAEGTLQDVDYKDLQMFSNEPTRSHLIRYCWELYTINLSDYKLQMRLELENGDECYAVIHGIYVVILTVLLYFVVPLWCIGKMIVFLYGVLCCCMVVVYPQYVSSMQLVLLIVYLVLQCVTFVCLYFVYKEQYILWHIGCGVSTMDLGWITPHDFVNRIRIHYVEIEELPSIKNALIDKFGPDVGYLIFKYMTTMIIARPLQQHNGNISRVDRVVTHQTGVSYQYGSLFAD
eukprot:1023961_1